MMHKKQKILKIKNTVFYGLLDAIQESQRDEEYIRKTFNDESEMILLFGDFYQKKRCKQILNCMIRSYVKEIKIMRVRDQRVVQRFKNCQLYNLQVLDVTFCNIKSLEPIISLHSPHIKKLILTSNQISSLQTLRRLKLSKLNQILLDQNKIIPNRNKFNDIYRAQFYKGPLKVLFQQHYPFICKQKQLVNPLNEHMINQYIRNAQTKSYYKFNPKVKLVISHQQRMNELGLVKNLSFVKQQRVKDDLMCLKIKL